MSDLVPVILAVVAAYVVYYLAHTPILRPPGPRGLPIVGNAFQMPQGHEWLRYAQWGAQYGPLVYLRLFTQDVYILNSYHAASEILDKNSSKSADRPRAQVMVGEIGWNKGVAFSPAGPRHRKYRKLLSSSLNTHAARRLSSLQQSSALQLLRALLESPERLSDHVRASIGNNTVNIVFGEQISTPDFDYIALADDAHHKFALAATPYRYAVDYLPLLKYVPYWFPGAAFKRQARQWRTELEHLVSTPYNTVKERAARGVASPSYVSNCIGDLSANKVAIAKDEETMWTAASLYTGGADTAIASILHFFLAMTLHPDIQRKGRDEILNKIGSERLPTLEDKASLPYIEAVVKEVLRWNPGAPLGIAHRTTDTIIYGNYEIPPGTFYTRTLAMMHDESVYKDPFTFDPERFLGAAPEHDPTTIAFGFGRRVCPGSHLALQSLFINIAVVLATMVIEPDGEMPEVSYTSGVISQPEPFKCRIRPYSEAAKELIIMQAD
ncbi:cytochrome P450 [Polyporus arcularius HHB13444]|uniref:Cytochrome P450 n=1 Tax=Polyporus arcularius HHB13444 TaxID=1314778 RepID=A0A5C3PJG2_9APHY|nr:cytochrome P450 [Polyporus arcularius HHB13444]